MNSLVFSIAPFLLLILFSCLLGLWVVLINRPNRQLEETGTKIGTYLAVSYLLWMICIVIMQDRIPILNIGQMLIFLAALIWWGQNFVQRRIRQRMLVVLPLVTVILIMTVSLIIGIQPDNLDEGLKSNSAAFHIGISLAGITLLLGSGVFGSGQLLLHRQIKSRKFGRIFNSMPPLSDLNKLRHISLLSGWTLFTLSMISALIWMLLKASNDGPVISHLHPMLTLWVIISFAFAASKYHWLSHIRLAITSAVLALLVLILLMISVFEIYSSGLA